MLLGTGTQIEKINSKRKSVTTTKTGSIRQKRGVKARHVVVVEKVSRRFFLCRLQTLQSAELL